MKNQFAEFNKLIEHQIKHENKCYNPLFAKEITDDLFNHYGYQWLIGSIDNYSKRLNNFKNEYNILNVAVYTYILWLKRGYHLNKLGLQEPVNTTVDIKEGYLTDFILTAYQYYEDNRFYLDTLLIEDALQKISNVLISFAQSSWHDVSEAKLCHIYCLSFLIWNEKYYEVNNSVKKFDGNSEEKIAKDLILNSLKEFFKDTEFGEIDLEVIANFQVNCLLKQFKKKD